MCHSHMTMQLCWQSAEGDNSLILRLSLLAWEWGYDNKKCGHQLLNGQKFDSWNSTRMTSWQPDFHSYGSLCQDFNPKQPTSNYACYWSQLTWWAVAHAQNLYPGSVALTCTVNYKSWVKGWGQAPTQMKWSLWRVQKLVALIKWKPRPGLWNLKASELCEKLLIVHTATTYRKLTSLLRDGVELYVPVPVRNSMLCPCFAVLRLPISASGLWIRNDLRAATPIHFK